MPDIQKGDSKEEFIQRYMSSPEAIKSFPDEKQRYAVAISEWQKKNHSFTNLGGLNMVVPNLGKDKHK